MMNEHSERQFGAYSSHSFQDTFNTFITRNTPRLTHYPQGSYIPPSDEQILDMVVRTITEKRTLSQSTDNDTVRVGSPVIEGRGHPSAEDIPEDIPERAEDIPERVDSPVVPCSSTEDDDGGRHEEGGSKEDGENAPLFRNNDTDYHTNSRPDEHSSEMGKEGTWSIKPVAEEMEEDLYCMTEFVVPNISQREEPGVATPSPDILASVQMTVLPDDVALKIQKGWSDVRYEDVTDDERPQMDVKPQIRGEGLLEPSCQMDILVETDDGFVCQPCAACVRLKELQKLERDTLYGINEMQDEQGELIVDEDEQGELIVDEDEQGKLIMDESPSVSAHADECYQSENETEDEEEEEDDDDWTVIGPMGIASLKWMDVGSKSAPASSRLEVFDNMECFKEAKAKEMGIAPDHIHGVEVNKSNAGTAAPIAPAGSRLPFGAAPQRSPQHSAEKSSYLMPLSPLSIVTALEHSSFHSSDSSNDYDLLGRNGNRRKVKRRKLSKRRKKVSDYSKSKAERDQDHNKPADCQKGGLILPEIERGPCTPQSNSSETENSSDCSTSPPQRNRLTFPSPFWNERSNSPLISYKRSISNSESSVHDDNGDAASSPLRRSTSHEPELDRQKKAETTILKTLLSTLNEKQQVAKKQVWASKYGSGGYSPESAASRLPSSLARQHSSESTENSVQAREKPSNSGQSSAVTKANVFKLGEGLPASKEVPSAFKISSMSSGIKEKLKNQMSLVYQVPSQSGGKLTSVEMDEEKSSTMSMPDRRKKRISHAPAPGQKCISHEPAPVQKRKSHESAPRQRHKSHENPLMKKTIAVARAETKRKATKVAPNEQSGAKDGLKGYKWKDNSRASPDVELDWK